MAGVIFRQMVLKRYPKGGIIYWVCVLYCIMLMVMMWRGIDVATSWSNISGWERVFVLSGSLLFVFSDFMITYKIVNTIPYHNIIIMSTYYTAQFCIANWSATKISRLGQIKNLKSI